MPTFPVSTRYTPSSVAASCFNVTAQTHLGLDALFLMTEEQIRCLSLSLVYIVQCCLIIQPATVTPKSAASQKTTVSACVFNSSPL